MLAPWGPQASDISCCISDMFLIHSEKEEEHCQSKVGELKNLGGDAVRKLSSGFLLITTSQC